MSLRSLNSKIEEMNSRSRSSNSLHIFEERKNGMQRKKSSKVNMELSALIEDLEESEERKVQDRVSRKQVGLE